MRKILRKSIEDLKKNWIIIFKLTFLFFILEFVLAYLLKKNIVLGLVRTCYNVILTIAAFEITKGNKKDILDFFELKRFLKLIIVHLVYTIKIFLWSLLFLIPGIIKMIEYSQVMYVVQDSVNFDINEIFKKSRKLMVGKKIKYFKILFINITIFFMWLIFLSKLIVNLKVFFPIHISLQWSTYPFVLFFMDLLFGNFYQSLALADDGDKEIF